MGFFSNFFSRFTGRVRYVGGAGTHSRGWNRSIEQQDICTSILDCNASHVAKAQVLHVKVDSRGRISKIERNSEYSKLFQRPNPYLSAFDFLYAMSWQLDLKNTAIAWIRWADSGNKRHPVEIWPINYDTFEIMDVTDGTKAIRFTDFDGEQHDIRMADAVILRRHYDGTGYVGGGNDPADQSIEIVQAVDDSMKDAATVSNKIHGLLKQKKTMLSPESVKESQTEFASRIVAAAKNGGVVVQDATEEYTPITINAWSANAAQMQQATDRIYGYWRTPRDVVLGTASEQAMQNYYDGVVEPRWQQMGQAFTSALFSSDSQNTGNRILVFGNSFDGMSWQSKIQIITATKETGLLSTNEQRDILGYPPVEDGDERLVSLNYIKAQDQSQYQTGTEKEKTNANET